MSCGQVCEFTATEFKFRQHPNTLKSEIGSLKAVVLTTGDQN